MRESTYGIFFVADYETQGLHNFVTAEIAVPVEDIRPPLSPEAETLKTLLYTDRCNILKQLLFLVEAAGVEPSSGLIY